MSLRPNTRHTVRHAGNIWLVDVYGGQLSGIILAEIELQSEDQVFDLPEWVGEEVTHNERFHKRTIGRLCRAAGRPLTVVELLNDRQDGVESCDSLRQAS